MEIWADANPVKITIEQTRNRDLSQHKRDIANPP
jgi:hypothetical protein